MLSQWAASKIYTHKKNVMSQSNNTSVEVVFPADVLKQVFSSMKLIV